MEISANPAILRQNGKAPASLAQNAESGKAESSQPTEMVERLKDDYEAQADIYNGSRHVGNKVSGAITGTVGHLGGNIALIPSTIGETYKNLWKAEKIGKYAKSVGSIVALAGIPIVAAGAIIASPFQGVAEAFHDESPYEKALVQDTTSKIADRITSKEDGPDTILGKAIESMKEFGNEKLAPGEEPWDIPIDKIAHVMVKVPVALYKGGKKIVVEGAKAGKRAAVKTAKFTKTYAPKLAQAAAAGLASSLIAGAGGLLVGIGVGIALAGKELVSAVTDKDRSIGSRLGGVAKTLAYIPVGPVMAYYSVKENFGRSFSEGWNGEPMKAIKTTGQAVVAKAKEALKSGKKEAN
jgi:hypothetical protein